jgi:hypothetical protein
MEDINGQLNTAKAGFGQGEQLTVHGEDQADTLEGRIEFMGDMANELSRTNSNVATVVGEIATTVTAARDKNGEATAMLGQTFQGQKDGDLNPLIQDAMAKGDEARLHLTEGENAGLEYPIGLEEIHQRTRNIGEHIAAIIEEIGLARVQSYRLTMHLQRSTHRSILAQQRITDYQQEKDLR